MALVLCTYIPFGVSLLLTACLSLLIRYLYHDCYSSLETSDGNESTDTSPHTLNNRR